MEGCFLRFYVHENARHGHTLVWQWLLEEANKLGIPGGSAFRAMAGFGRHKVLHEDHFFELAGSLTVEVEFIVGEAQADRLVGLVHDAGLRLFYARIPARFGVIGGTVDERPA